jgi:solute carrier family 25 (mitochondrial citrate transporter), member 1
MTQSEKKKQTTTQSFIIGSVAGATEVLVNHPLWSIKTRMQCGDFFTLNPAILYRGILPNAASMIPITALQVSLNSCFQHLVFHDRKELSYTQRITSAFFAGMGSALMSCPTEMVMTHQRTTDDKFYASGRNLIKKNGFRSLYKALPATAAREGIFAACFLGVTPILKMNIQPFCANDYLTSLSAGMGAGIIATIASQGIDTIKTVQQASQETKAMNIKNAIHKIYSTQGVYGFFKGGIPRGGRVMSAITIMGWVTEKMETGFRQK